jgi:hypothetical protein
MLFLWTAISGWTATLLLGAGIGIPYFVRNTPAAAASVFARLRPHYRIGFLIPAISFLHAWFPMSAGRMRGFDRSGLLLATAALLAMCGQVGLGLTLRDSTGADHRRTQRLHFWSMAAIVSLVAAHIVFNRV